MFFLFQTCWTFPPALDLSPGIGTSQKDERKGSNRRGMEERRRVEREGGGAAVEMETKILGGLVQALDSGDVCGPHSSSPSPWAQGPLPLHHFNFHQH